MRFKHEHFATAIDNAIRLVKKDDISGAKRALKKIINTEEVYNRGKVFGHGMREKIGQLERHLTLLDKALTEAVQGARIYKKVSKIRTGVRKAEEELEMVLRLLKKVMLEEVKVVGDVEKEKKEIRKADKEAASWLKNHINTLMVVTDIIHMDDIDGNLEKYLHKAEEELLKIKRKESLELRLIIGDAYRALSKSCDILNLAYEEKNKDDLLKLLRLFNETFDDALELLNRAYEEGKEIDDVLAAAEA